MAEPEVVIASQPESTPAADVEMSEDAADSGAAAAAAGAGENGEGQAEPSGLEDIEPEVPERITFLE